MSTTKPHCTDIRIALNIHSFTVIAMPTVRISVFEERGHGEKLVESRFVDIEAARKLNRAMARRILVREFSISPHSIILRETPRGWRHSTALKPKEKCDYHYVWRHYYIASA